MFGIEIVKQVKFTPITEEQLTDLIKEKIAELHPEVSVTDLKFSKSAKTGISVTIVGELSDGASEPKAVTRPKKNPIKLPEGVVHMNCEADDVEEEQEVKVSRDGVLSSQEQQESDLIDEVLAEEANDEEVPFDTTDKTAPEVETTTTKGKSLAEMFQSV